MKPLVFLALISCLCTSVSAQIADPKLKTETTNIAFIKGKTGFIIDSIAISTSLDTVPYGFPFTGDTLYLDVTIFSPVDYLMVETFGGDHPFGLQACWVDGPFADVHLSIDAGRGRIDSVSNSFVDGWYRNKLEILNNKSSLSFIKYYLESNGIDQCDNLMSAKFLASYFDLPNLERVDLKNMKETAYKFFSPKIFRHPWLRPIRQKIRLAGGNLPGPLRKHPLLTVEEEYLRRQRPATDFYVLNFYRSSDPLSQRQHRAIQEIHQKDSLFSLIPIISIDTEGNQSRWRSYLERENFSWPHYRSNRADPKSLAAKMKYEGSPFYLLINERNRIEGIYDDLERLLVAMVYRKQLKLSKL